MSRIRHIMLTCTKNTGDNKVATEELCVAVTCMGRHAGV